MKTPTTELDLRERIIIQMRQGNYVDKKGKRHPKMTLQEVGRFWFGISRERVRQIEQKAKLKLMGIPS